MTARAAGWREVGVHWQLQRGPTRSKSSASVDCTTGHHLAQLIVWTSGEAELSVVDRSTGAIATTTYE